MSNLTNLTTQHTAAKEARKAASAEFGAQSEQAKEARKLVDRLYQAIKRAEKAPVEDTPAPSITDVIADTVTEHVAKRDNGKKATPVSEADYEVGIYARRKVRRTGNVVERIDGSRSPLGTEGGRWVLRIVGSRKAPKRFQTRKELNKAARNA